MESLCQQRNNLHDSPPDCLTSKFTVPCRSWSTNRYFPCLTAPYTPLLQPPPPPPLTPTDWQRPCLFPAITRCNCFFIFLLLDQQCYLHVALCHPLDPQRAGGRINQLTHKAPTILYGSHIIHQSHVTLTNWTSYHIKHTYKAQRAEGENRVNNPWYLMSRNMTLTSKAHCPTLSDTQLIYGMVKKGIMDIGS